MTRLTTADADGLGLDNAGASVAAGPHVGGEHRVLVRPASDVAVRARSGDVRAGARRGVRPAPRAGVRSRLAPSEHRWSESSAARCCWRPATAIDRRRGRLPGGPDSAPTYACAMLAEDAFLRRLPLGLAPIQALQIETLVYCGDAVEASYGAIKSIALAHGEQMVNQDRRGARLHMFINAWTIVDCVHVACNLLRALGYPSEFQTKYEVATRLRNKMDHVANQARNLANRRDQPPLLGTISYAVEQLEQDGAEFRLGGGTIIGISLGRIRTRATLGDLVNPASIPAPVAYADEVAQSGGVVAHGFQLAGFEPSLVLPLEAAANDLIALLCELNDRVSQRLPAQLQKHAASEGLDVEEVMRPAVGDLCVYVKFVRDDESSNPSDASS